jgi:hypothetical protein
VLVPGCQGLPMCAVYGPLHTRTPSPPLRSMPCFMSHASIPADVRAARGLPDDLVRISGGPRAHGGTRRGWGELYRPGGSSRLEAW